MVYFVNVTLFIHICVYIFSEFVAKLFSTIDSIRIIVVDDSSINDRLTNYLKREKRGEIKNREEKKKKRLGRKLEKNK